MRTSVAAAAMVAAFGAMPAMAGPGTCLAVASDAAKGHSVLVRLHVGADGQIGSREAEWELKAPGPNMLEGLSLKIAYVEQVPAGMGPVTSVTLNFLAMNHPGLLRGASGTLTNAAGKRWTARFGGMFGLGKAQLSVKTPWGGRVSPELTERIETMAPVTVAMTGPDGKVLATAQLDPTDLVSRDRLFEEARAKAEALAAAKARCA